MVSMVNAPTEQAGALRDPLLLDNQLCYALYAAAHRMTKSYRPMLERMGLTYPQYLVLLVLWETDGVTVSEIGRRLRLDDVARLTVQAIILVALGFAFGMRGSWYGVILGIVITIVLGSACAASSNALALTTKSEDVMAPVINMVMMPVLLLSGILLPMSLGPEWLQKASNIMPIKHVVSAVRDTFAGNLGSSTVIWGVGWVLVLFAAALWWGTRTFRKENV